MRRLAVAALCFAGLFAGSARAQEINLEPIHVAAGTVLTFHVQTRLHTTTQDETDALPRGTIILVKMLDPIDSSVDHDGARFRGAVASPIVAGNKVIVPADSEVQGLFALLRSRAHPEGFRYELLVTSVSDHGKSYPLTASLNPSFFDGSTHTASVSGTEEPESSGEGGPTAAQKQVTPRSN